MAWVTKVVKVLGEYKNRAGELKYKWEITRPVNEEQDKQFERGLQKTGFYKKEGIETRGYPQPFTKQDLNWIRENWSKIQEAIDPAPGSEDAPTAKPAIEGEIVDTPF